MQAVGVQRLRDFDPDEFTHAHPRDGSREAGQDPSVGQRVVGLPAFLAIGGCGGEALFHAQVVEQFVFGDALEMRQAGPVTQYVAHGDVVFTVGAELRPVPCDGLVIGQQAAIDKAVDDHGGDPFGRGEHHRPRIGCPRLFAQSVGPACPHIDNGSAVDVDGQRATTEPSAREQSGEDSDDVSEAGVSSALDVARQPFPRPQSDAFVIEPTMIPRAPLWARNRDIQPATLMTLADSCAPGGPSSTTSCMICAWSFCTVNSPFCGAFPPTTS